MKRVSLLVAPLIIASGAVPAAGAQLAPIAPLPLTAPREASPVVLNGLDLPELSAPAPVPVRVLETDEQNAQEVTPPGSSTDGANVAVDSLAVFSVDDDGSFREIPSQVDERFWRYLANFGGENGPYSGYDPELTYVFDEEVYRKQAGRCYAKYPEGEPITTPDNVPGFDDDDELVFMARDAGGRAAVGATPVDGVTPYEVAIKDPVTELVSYVYVVSVEGIEHNFGEGYVSYERDEFGDRFTSVRGGQGIPEGPICDGPDGDDDELTDEGPAPTRNGARRPRDWATFTSDTYTFHWAGRWVADEIHLATEEGYGPDLIDQWKGRAFQQTREQAVSIGFIGDKAWEESSVTLGERSGPIRVMRETWGAKSGTNVTRLYMLYDQIFYDIFYLRVHPIPPDGIYSMWDNNQGAITRFYSPVTAAEGVPVDGVNDEKVGNVDIGEGTPAESHYDIADPTLQAFSPVGFWEQLAGPSGSIVYYTAETRPGPGVLTSYYRDDANFDDGSGSDPVGAQGSFGAHGIHFYATGDTDNKPFGFPFSEMGVQQAQYMVPGQMGNVGEAYATTERFPLEITTVYGP